MEVLSLNYKLSPAQVRELLHEKLTSELGVAPGCASDEQLYKACVMVVRELLTEGRADFMRRSARKDAKQVYYMCMEFLMGRSLKNSLFSLGLEASFSAALKEISKKVGIILLLSDLLALPDFITHVYAVKECADFRKYTVKEYLRDSPFKAETGRRELPEQKRAAILNLPAAKESGSEYVVRLKDVTIAYGGKTILDKVSWDIKRGEHWALSGHNGSGKSTLLNLITADNPQSYACDIELFGRKRGSGESIWDIKREIGYVSPELHRAFQKNVSVRDIVASGLLDTVGLYVKPPKEKMPLCDFWMDMFGIGGIAEKMFLRISSGEQRLALLARAFVKDPQLLILDEPLHGLDTCNRMLTREIIETFCRRPGKTLIMVTHYPQELPSCIDKIKKL